MTDLSSPEGALVLDQFAESVASKEATSFLLRLGLTQSRADELSSLASAHLVNIGSRFPGLDQSAGEARKYLTDHAESTLERAVTRFWPSHAEALQMYLWLTRVFFTLDAKVDPLRQVSHRSASAIIGAVAVYKHRTLPVQAALREIETSWQRRYQLDDRFPFSGLAQMISWHEYKALWAAIERDLDESNRYNFIRSAMSSTKYQDGIRPTLEYPPVRVGSDS